MLPLRDGIFREPQGDYEALQVFIRELLSVESRQLDGDFNAEYASELAYLSVELSHSPDETDVMTLRLDYGVLGDESRKAVGMFCCNWNVLGDSISEIQHIALDGEHASISDFVDRLSHYQGLPVVSVEG